MKPTQHLALSAVSGVLVGLVLRSWAAGISCFLIGVFIDVDHFVDLWLNRGFTLRPAALLDFCYFGTSRKFYDVLHGWEYVPVYLWISTFPGLREAGLGLTVGYTLHLLADQCCNTHLHRLTYFFSFRALHRFESSKIVLSSAPQPGKGAK